MTRSGQLLIASVFTCILSAAALAQVLSPATEPSATTGVPLTVSLAPVYESQTGGISLRPPADAKQVTRGSEADLIVEFINEQKQWALKVNRTTFERPMQLSSDSDAPLDRQGILQLTAAAFKQGQINVEVVRQDVVNAGDTDIGRLAMRYGPPQQRKLAQQAIFKSADRVFYTLTFNSPSAKSDETNVADAAEIEAVNTFNAIVDTVKLLDRRFIKQEQDQRLRRTQALLVNFNQRRLADVAQKQQWMRIIRDGEDIGYLYVVEEPYTYGGTEGLLVLIRSRTTPDAGIMVDGASSLWASYDRKEEFWVSNFMLNNGQPKAGKVSETGTSYQRVRNIRVDPATAAPGEKIDRNAIIRQEDEFLLTVERTASGSAGVPLIRQLPPYYLSQMLGHLLPRLLPLDEPAGYLFVSWVSDRQELMFRYVDVAIEEDVDIFGKKMRAVPVLDRLGLEGTPTIHYLSPEGEYLGAKTETLDGKGKTVVSWILPTDAATLTAKWKDAVLTRPETAAPVSKPKARTGR